MNDLEPSAGSSMECSPEAPWGLHVAVTDNVCPRCGWVARDQAPEPEAAPLP